MAKKVKSKLGKDADDPKEQTNERRDEENVFENLAIAENIMQSGGELLLQLSPSHETYQNALGVEEVVSGPPVKRRFPLSGKFSSLMNCCNLLSENSTTILKFSQRIVRAHRTYLKTNSDHQNG